MWFANGIWILRVRTFANSVCDWYLHWNTKKKTIKIEKWKKSNVTRNVASLSGHVAGHERGRWATFVNCPQQCCWSRFRPRWSQCGHVCSHVVAMFNVAGTWPTRWLSSLATLQRGQWSIFLSCSGHVRGHIPVTFVVMFVATFKHDFWSFFACFLEVFEIDQMRLVYAFGTMQMTSKNGF